MSSVDIADMQEREVWLCTGIYDDKLQMLPASTVLTKCAALSGSLKTGPSWLRKCITYSDILFALYGPVEVCKNLVLMLTYLYHVSDGETHSVR